MSDIGSCDHGASVPCQDTLEGNKEIETQIVTHPDIPPLVSHHIERQTSTIIQTSYHQKPDTASCGHDFHLESNKIESEKLFTTVGIPITGSQNTGSDVIRPNKSTSDSITPGTTPVESSLKRLKQLENESTEETPKLLEPNDRASTYTNIADNQQPNIGASTSSYRPPSDVNTTAENADGDGESDYVTIGSSDEEADLSDVSSLSGINWKPKPITGLNNWVHRRMCDGSSPREILNHMLPNSQIPEHLDEVFLWQIIFNLLNEPACRKKLTSYNTIDDAVDLIKKSKNIIVLTGAGVSTSSGIPDFRSRDGIYARLHQDFPDLPDPQAMFDISYFKKDPRPFFKFAKEIYPGQFQPAIGHYFIKCLEKHELLLRNYTQNIDTLEQVAGIQRVINCHGSFASATCTNCKYQVDASIIKDDIFEQRIPKCPMCPTDNEELAVMKPDIVFFGEGLPDTFHDAIGRDKDECDLLIVIGSSMKVRPVALIPSSIPDNIPQILINREPLGHLVFDIELLGDCDVIIQEICLRLGDDWAEICTPGADKLAELTELPPKDEVSSIPATDDTQAMETGDQDLNKDITNQLTGEELRTNNEPVDTQIQPAMEKIEKTTEADGAIMKDSSCAIDDHNDVMGGVSEEDGFGSAVAEAASPAASSDISSVDEYDDVASQLPPASYLYVAPSRYIFRGAEINIQTLEKYKKKHDNQADETLPEDKPTVAKHNAHMTSDSSTFSSVGSSMATSSSDSSSSPDCSSIDRSPVNISAQQLGTLNNDTSKSTNSSADKNVSNTCESAQDDNGMLTEAADEN